jgi:hypothetical protein
MPSYGTLDGEYASQLVTRPPEEEGPVWMVNFMKYRARADYGDGQDSGISGREADDRYAPRGILDDIGAEVVFFGDVVAGDAWDRIGIVRYPTHRSFMEMQYHPGFRQQHRHKAAGMDHTIVVGTQPVARPAREAGGLVVFELVVPDTPLVVPGAGRLRVEGTILGDGRHFAELGVAWCDDAGAVPPCGPAREVAVVRPSIDLLARELRERT